MVSQTRQRQMGLAFLAWCCGIPCIDFVAITAA
jgi:hypothetical protein